MGGGSSSRIGGRCGRAAIAAASWTARRGGRTIAYVVRGKRIRTVAVAARKAARKRGALRRLLRHVPRKGIAPRPPAVVSRVSARVPPEKAVPEVAQRDGAQFPLYCGL